MSAASAGKVKAKRVAAFTASSTSHACCELCDAQTGTDENTPIANRRERHELVPRRERDRRGIVEVHSIRICHLCRRVVDNWFADELLAEHLSTKDSLKDALLDAGWFNIRPRNPAKDERYDDLVKLTPAIENFKRKRFPSHARLRSQAQGTKQAMLDELDQKLKEFEDLHKEKKRQIKAEFQEDPVVPGPQLIELDSESDDAIAQEAVGNQQAEEAEEDGQPAQEAQALAPAPALPQRPLYVSDKPFKCHVSHCGKGYKTKKRLSKHATSKHNKQVHFCDFPGCTKAYGRKGNLDKHKRETHRGWKVVEGNWTAPTEAELAAFDDGRGSDGSDADTSEAESVPAKVPGSAQRVKLRRKRKRGQQTSTTSSDEAITGSDSSDDHAPVARPAITRAIVRRGTPPAAGQPLRKARRIQQSSPSSDAGNASFNSSDSDNVARVAAIPKPRQTSAAKVKAEESCDSETSDAVMSATSDFTNATTTEDDQPPPPPQRPVWYQQAVPRIKVEDEEMAAQMEDEEREDCLRRNRPIKKQSNVQVVIEQPRVAPPKTAARPADPPRALVNASERKAQAVMEGPPEQAAHRDVERAKETEAQKRNEERENRDAEPSDAMDVDKEPEVPQDPIPQHWLEPIRALHASLRHLEASPKSPNQKRAEITELFKIHVLPKMLETRDSFSQFLQYVVQSGEVLGNIRTPFKGKTIKNRNALLSRIFDKNLSYLHWRAWALGGVFHQEYALPDQWSFCEATSPEVAGFQAWCWEKMGHSTYIRKKLAVDLHVSKTEALRLCEKAFVEAVAELQQRHNLLADQKLQARARPSAMSQSPMPQRPGLSAGKATFDRTLADALQKAHASDFQAGGRILADCILTESRNIPDCTPKVKQKKRVELLSKVFRSFVAAQHPVTAGLEIDYSQFAHICLTLCSARKQLPGYVKERRISLCIAKTFDHRFTAFHWILWTLLDDERPENVPQKWLFRHATADDLNGFEKWLQQATPNAGRLQQVFRILRDAPGKVRAWLGETMKPEDLLSVIEGKLV